MPRTHKRDGTAVALPSGDLTTHGVIVGMTGSGKTGLGIVLIEEALSAGVPVIAIDPKGDLTNLLPAVSRTWPRPTFARGSTKAMPPRRG